MWYNEYTKRGRKTPQTRKEIIMKKNTLSTVIALLSDLDFANKEELMNELYTDFNRGAEEKAQKAAEYEAAWPAVREALNIAPEITVADIFHECEKELPAGFSKSKIQYGLGHAWADKVVKIEGKPNRYSLKA